MKQPSLFHAAPWVPAEWIEAHGVTPRGVWSAEDFRLELTGLTAGVCAFAQSMVRCAESTPPPRSAASHSAAAATAAFLFTTHCDQLRRGFDAVPGPGRGFLFNLPATWQTPAAERLFTAELLRLGRFLESMGGHSPTDEALAAAISRQAQARRSLLARAEDTAARPYLEAVARFFWDGSLGPPDPAGAGARDGVRLALVGGPLPRAQWRLLEVIEAAGGRVVLVGTEPGERHLWLGPEPAPGADRAGLLTLLARNYLAHCVDMFARPNTHLYEWLGRRLAARRVQGLVLWHWVGCDLWRAEAQSLREAFGLPVLVVEADTAAGGWQRVTGRLEAFLEALAP